VACGSMALVEGRIYDGKSDSIGFMPDDTHFLRRRFGIGMRPVRAYGCTRCGHLQLGVEFSEADLKNYREFEGQQPTVLERLNPEKQEPEP
jgi:hypothetical protein